MTWKMFLIVLDCHWEILSLMIWKKFLLVLVCHLGDSVIHDLENVLDGAGLTLKKIPVAAALCESLVEVIFNLPDLDRS